jgi:hypothetical protein
MPGATVSRRPIIIAVIAGVVAVAALAYFIGRDFFQTPKPSTKTVDIFFGSLKSDTLERERRDIPAGGVESEAAEVLRALIEGSRHGLVGVMPEGTRLLSLKIEAGTATADFSRALVEKHWGGSASELLTVYGIVNSLAMNFPEIKNVQILVEGERVETISGHIMINIPLGADPDMIGK